MEGGKRERRTESCSTHSGMLSARSPLLAGQAGPRKLFLSSLSVCLARSLVRSCPNRWQTIPHKHSRIHFRQHYISFFASFSLRGRFISTRRSEDFCFHSLVLVVFEAREPRALLLHPLSPPPHRQPSRLDISALFVFVCLSLWLALFDSVALAFSGMEISAALELVSIFLGPAISVTRSDFNIFSISVRVGSTSHSTAVSIPTDESRLSPSWIDRSIDTTGHDSHQTDGKQVLQGQQLQPCFSTVGNQQQKKLTGEGPSEQ